MGLLQPWFWIPTLMLLHVCHCLWLLSIVVEWELMMTICHSSFVCIARQTVEMPYHSYQAVILPTAWISLMHHHLMLILQTMMVPMLPRHFAWDCVALRQSLAILVMLIVTSHVILTLGLVCGTAVMRCLGGYRPRLVEVGRVSPWIQIGLEVLFKLRIVVVISTLPAVLVFTKAVLAAGIGWADAACSFRSLIGWNLCLILPERSVLRWRNSLTSADAKTASFAKWVVFGPHFLCLLWLLVLWWHELWLG